MTDLGVSFTAGAAKLPADVGNLIVPDNPASEWWERTVNKGRDFLQREELVRRRNELDAYRASITDADGNFDIPHFIAYSFQNYPDVAANYVAELGLPTKGVVKGAVKLTQNVGKVGKYMGRTGDLSPVGALGYVAATHAAIKNDLTPTFQFDQAKTPTPTSTR